MPLAHIPPIRFHPPPTTSVCFPHAPLSRRVYPFDSNIALLPPDYSGSSCILVLQVYVFLGITPSRQSTAY